MMHAVVDTNVLLRMAAGERRSPLFVAWREKRFILVVSAGMLNEFRDVATRPKVRRFLPPLRGKKFIEMVQDLALFVTPAREFPIAATPKTTL